MDLPRRFGKYELLDHVATGGMAEVFRARSFGVEGFERQICIKRILPGLSRDPRFVSMFVKEARICSGIAHPNVVQIYELGRIGDDHYMAMEFVHGRDLGRILRTMRRSRTPMPVGVAVHVVVEALRGLGCAHGMCDADGRALGVVHRDISPHNILVGFEGETKVFDFGVAQLGAAESGGKGGGKRAYMAPEQARGQELDQRSDLYAMGVVLFELLTSRRPTPATIERPTQPIEDVRHLRPEVPEPIAACVAALLAPHPTDRPPTAHDAADQLRAALYESGLQAHSDDLRRFLTSLYPDVRTRSAPGTVDLGGLASDVVQLGHSGPGEATPSSRTSSGGDSRPEGGRRPVVTLLAEVVGLTDATVRLESEHIFRRHLRLLRRAWRVVEAHGGTIEEWRDDTLTVLFGLPRASGHDVERALACAEALVEVARGLPESVGRVELCIGVHQGEISVASRSGRRHRYVAHGDTVKLARRLSMVADAGEVLVSEHVAGLGRRRFEFEEGPALQRRKVNGGQRAWRLVRRRARDQVNAGRWVARGDELSIISRALSMLGDGEGTRLAVLGPAGSGKSRLLRDVVVLARRRGARVAGVRGLPYGAGGGTRVLHDLVRAILGLEDAPITGADLDDRLVRMGLEAEERTALRALVAGRARGKQPRTRQASRRRAEEAVAALMRELSRAQPVIVAVEDVQYLDDSEHRLLRGVFDRVRDLPVLWWLSAREALPDLLEPADRVIRLDRMPADRMRSLAAQLMDAREIGPALWRSLSRSSEGNPLYIETIVGTLQQAERIVVTDGVARLRDPGRSVRPPPGLDALIAERVDALEPALRGLLQLAVTIGPRFSIRLLGAAAGLDDPRQLVEGLVGERLVVWVGDPEDGRCAVASTLIGQVVQRSLLGAQRRSCHRAVAAAIARLHADDLTPHRVALATHCAGAGDFIDAARHGVRAGQWFGEQQLLDQATRVYEGALEHVEQARESGEETSRCAHAEAVVRADLGACLARSRGGEAAERHLRISLDLSADLLLPEIEASAHLELGRLLHTRGDVALAAAHLEAARDTALAGLTHHTTPTWRVQLAVRALEALAVMRDESGEADSARESLEAARELAAHDVQLMGRVWLALARPALRTGDRARSRTLLEKALECAIESGNRILEGKVRNNIGIVHHAAGEYDEAIACFEAARRIREGLGYRRGAAINLHNIGDTWLRRGEHGRAWAAFTDSRAIAERLGWRRGLVMNDLFLAFLELRRTRWTGTGARRLFDRLQHLIDEARSLGDLETAVTGRLLLARGLRGAGRLSEAARELQRALDRAERLDARVLARDLRLEQAALAVEHPGVVTHHLADAGTEAAR